MIDYFKITADRRAQENTLYYKKEEDEKELFGAKFICLDLQPNELLPTDFDVYETTTPNKENRQLDKHFKFDENGYIQFFMSPKETNLFSVCDVSDESDFVFFEIAYELNYDSPIDNITGDIQQNILVIDSAFSDVLPYRGESICSNEALPSNVNLLRN